MKQFLSILLCIVAVSACTPQPEQLVILHTNDTHSQVEPNNANLGGYARRMGIIAAERAQNPDLLLLDAGDFSQGTPYFNFYHGRVEVDAMNRMGYDVVTLGNHEFDNGVDTLAAILRNAKFEVVCANYKLNGCALEGIVKPYTILKRQGLKIGVFGLGVEPGTLIGESNFAPLEYVDPYVVAQKTAALLKREKKCDVVICLSHLGTVYEDEPDSPSDVKLAELSTDIDVIIGGHTHRLYDLRIANAIGKEIPVVQMRKAGIYIGKIILDICSSEK